MGQCRLLGHGVPWHVLMQTCPHQAGRQPFPNASSLRSGQAPQVVAAYRVHCQPPFWRKDVFRMSNARPSPRFPLLWSFALVFQHHCVRAKQAATHFSRTFPTGNPSRCQGLFVLPPDRLSAPRGRVCSARHPARRAQACGVMYFSGNFQAIFVSDVAPRSHARLCKVRRSNISA